MTRIFLKVHKWLSLTLALFWILQATSGILLAFHREIDDFFLTPNPPPGERLMLSASVSHVIEDEAGSRVLRLLASGGHPNFFDVIYEDTTGQSMIARIDASTSKIYRRAAWNGSIGEVPISRSLFVFHKELLSGDIGHWIVGITGVSLATTISLGLIIGWPRRGTWSKVMFPKAIRWKSSRLYLWHRAVGLWAALLLLLMGTTGAMQVWVTPITQALDATISRPNEPSVAFIPNAVDEIDKAVELAWSRFPQSKLTMVELPSKRFPYFRIRFSQPEESRQVAGRTTVYVDQEGANVLQIHDAVNADLRYRAVSGIVPLHSGEMFGLIGRIVGLLAGISFIGLIFLGVSLWWKRR